MTSAPLAQATVRLKAARIPRPPVLVTCEDVTIGNPHPQCYELAIRKLGVNVKECLVFEDAAAGVLAARAAGARVVVVSETHVHPIEPTCTTIPAYEDLVAHVDGEGVHTRPCDYRSCELIVGCGDIPAPGSGSATTFARQRTRCLQVNDHSRAA